MPERTPVTITRGRLPTPISKAWLATMRSDTLPVTVARAICPLSTLMPPTWRLKPRLVRPTARSRPRGTSRMRSMNLRLCGPGSVSANGVLDSPRIQGLRGEGSEPCWTRSRTWRKRPRRRSRRRRLRSRKRWATPSTPRRRRGASAPPRPRVAATRTLKKARKAIGKAATGPERPWAGPWPGQEDQERSQGRTKTRAQEGRGHGARAPKKAGPRRPRARKGRAGVRQDGKAKQGEGGRPKKAASARIPLRTS